MRLSIRYYTFYYVSIFGYKSMCTVAYTLFTIIAKTKSAILKNEKYIFWCFPAISGASV